jgi:phosphate starvation-inducible protein PhoH
MATRKKPTTTQTTDEPKKTRKEIICEIIKKKSKEKFLSDNQKIYYDILKSNQITICSGPAGVGKSYIAMNISWENHKRAKSLLFKMLNQHIESWWD